MSNGLNTDGAPRPRRSWRASIGYLLLFVVALQLLEHARRADVMTVRVADALGWTNDPQPADVYAADDAKLLAIGGGAGNIALRFEGFNVNRAEDRSEVMKHWYRAVYVLHPRRVVVAPAGTLLNDGKDLLLAPTIKSEALLWTMGVRNELTIARTSDGGTEWRVRTVSGDAQ